MQIHVVDGEGREHALEALEGWRVMEIIRDWGLPMKAECGGAAACGTCLVRVDPEWKDFLVEPNDEELDMLDTLPDVDDCTRLSCQILMSDKLDGLRVQLVGEEAAAVAA